MVETGLNDKSIWKSVVSGSISGLTVRFIISPLDILKIRLQLERNHNKSISTVKIITQLIKNEGIKSFWKGNLPAEIMYLLYGGTQFSSYTILKNHVFNKEIYMNEEFKKLIVGGLSGCAGTLVSYPFDTLRTRLAADKSKGFKNLSNTIKNTRKNESMKGFYDGLKPTLIQIFFHTGLSFYFYESFKTRINDNTPLCGFLAGTISKTLVFPLDSIKRRLQIKNSKKLIEQKNYEYLHKNNFYNSKKIFKIWLNIIKVEGVLSLYKGLGIAILKSGPASSLSFTIYEMCMKWL